MGVLAEEDTLEWPEIHKISRQLRRHGLRQYVLGFHAARQARGDERLWGDELECLLVTFDHVKHKVKLLLRADALFKQIAAQPALVTGAWSYEYTDFMFEGMPAQPYDSLASCAGAVLCSFASRRAEINRLLNGEGRLLTLSTFPLFGTRDFTEPSVEPVNAADNRASNSCLVSERILQAGNKHFEIVTQNILDRRGSKPFANVPVYVDTNTPRPFVDDVDGRVVGQQDLDNRRDDHIYLDSMLFGPSSCSLQVTMGCASMQAAYGLRDQLVPLAPVLLALSASTPALRGLLSDHDSRWLPMKQCSLAQRTYSCLDDRTEEERSCRCSAPDPDHVHIPYSRNDSVEVYVSERHSACNDRPVPYDVESYNELVKNDVPEGIALDLAHLFIREPLQVQQSALDQDDHMTEALFESIHLFHWRTVRVKLPPRNGSSGWKVEFRPMEVQLNDFENASLTVFVFVLSRLLLLGRLNLVVPISNVFANMDTAIGRAAAINGRFWWAESPGDSTTAPVQLSIDQIVNGSAQHGVRGLAAHMYGWLDEQKGQGELSAAQYDHIMVMLKLVAHRASGAVPTAAAWLRSQLVGHTAYARDSVVSQHMAHDVLLQADHLAELVNAPALQADALSCCECVMQNYYQPLA